MFNQNEQSENPEEQNYCYQEESLPQLQVHELSTYRPWLEEDAQIIDEEDTEPQQERYTTQKAMYSEQSTCFTSNLIHQKNAFENNFDNKEKASDCQFGRLFDFQS